jgi:general secretion pathway protein D
VQPDKTVLTDFGSSVTPKLDEGGPFIDLRKKQTAPNAPQPAGQQSMPASDKPAIAAAPGSVNDSTP